MKMPGSQYCNLKNGGVDLTMVTRPDSQAKFITLHEGKVFWITCFYWAKVEDYINIFLVQVPYGF